MHFDVTRLASSPFADFTAPGLILGGLFGVQAWRAGREALEVNRHSH